MQPRMINLADIKAIYYEPHGFDFGKTKSFGKTCSPVCTFSSDTNVVIDSGEKTLKGFSVKDIDEFMGYIKELVNSGVVIQDKFPFSTDCKAESAD
uniref:Uncharacterized protein n=1 Tax=Plectus sambesii TaxID=2011161 RepID=A0A914WNM8_9BILA